MLTSWFGVTATEAERNLSAEQGYIEEITQKVLLMQANAAAKQHCPLHRGTHAKGVTALARFEVFDVTAGRDPVLAARLAQGMFKRPGIYPATIRCGNSDSQVNSDFKPDLRSLSFLVDLTRNGSVIPAAGVERQDFTLQRANILPLNDARAFIATMKVLTASKPVKGLLALSLADKLRVVRAIGLAQLQSRQPLKPYQQLRYWSDVPFRHGPVDVVKQSATPSPSNIAHPLQKSNSDALQKELARHLAEDGVMSSFEFGLQFLDTANMTYWGKRRDANFWIENASVEWKETEAPFHTVARLTLLSKSQRPPDAAEATYSDVTGNSTPDSTPVGSINRARWPAEAASRKARFRARNSGPETT